MGPRPLCAVAQIDPGGGGLGPICAIACRNGAPRGEVCWGGRSPGVPAAARLSATKGVGMARESGSFSRVIRLVCLLVVAAAALPGIAAAMQDVPEDTPVCDTTLPTFAAPLRLGTGTGYEPGIRIDSTGVMYYTAHKVFPAGAGLFESS